MERSRSHIVASAQLNVFFVYTLMLYIFVMKSQNRAKLACLYKLWAPKLYFAKKRKTSLGGPKMLRESIFFNKIGSCRGVHIFQNIWTGRSIFQICHDRFPSALHQELLVSHTYAHIIWRLLTRAAMLSLAEICLN